jgi:beta-lactamase regulating signal transducer with metallopeptidase domain
MNVGVVLLAVLMIFAASIGIIAMATRNEAAPVDTIGHTISTQENVTHDLITGVAAPAAQTGGGIGLAVVVLFVCGMLFAVFVLILYGKKGNWNSSGR